MTLRVFWGICKAGLDEFMEIAKQPFFKNPQAGSINISLLNDAVDKGKDVLKGWRKNHRIDKISDAADINQDFISKGYRPPYKPGTKVFEFTTETDGNG